MRRASAGTSAPRCGTPGAHGARHERAGPAMQALVPIMNARGKR
jgi:hypothetical protein